MATSLVNQYISASFDKVVQISGSYLANGTGTTISSLDLTVSNATSASHAVNADSSISSSYSVSALSSSYSNTSTSASHAISADTSISSSHALASNTSISSSYASNASTADSALLATTASYVAGANVDGQVSTAASANTATSASHALVSDTVSDVNIAYKNVNNTFTGTQTFNTINADSASIGHINYVTGSATIIGDAFVVLNTDSPALRYAGIQVIDSGSLGITASLQWDSTKDIWLQVEDDGTSAGLITGMSGSLGTEAFPTKNTIVKGGGDHQITDSSISDDGSYVTFTSPIRASGSIEMGLGTSVSFFERVDPGPSYQTSALRFFSGSTPGVNYVNMQSVPGGDGIVAISSFPANNHFLFFNPLNWTTEFDGKIKGYGKPLEIYEAATITGSTANVNTLISDTTLSARNSSTGISVYNTSGYGGAFGAYNAAGRDFGIALDSTQYGAGDWTYGPAFINDIGAVTFPTVIGFDGPGGFGDNRVTFLTPLSASAGITGDLTGNVNGTATNALTASYLTGNVESASYAATASIASLAQSIEVEFNGSDSTKYLILSDNENGTTAAKTGGLTYNPDSQVLDVTSGTLNISGSLIGNATTATNALTASYLLGSVESASYASTADALTAGDKSISGTLTATKLVLTGGTGTDLQVTGNASFTLSVAAGGSVYATTSGTTAQLVSTGGGFVEVMDPSGDNIGFGLNPSAYGTSGWSGPGLWLNNPSDQYPVVIGFQNKASWTDGRITFLTPISASAGIIGDLTGNADTATSASHAVNADTAVSASYATTSGDAGTWNGQYTGSAGISGSLDINGTFLAAYPALPNNSEREIFTYANVVDAKGTSFPIARTMMQDYNSPANYDNSFTTEFWDSFSYNYGNEWNVGPRATGGYLQLSGSGTPGLAIFRIREAGTTGKTEALLSAYTASFYGSGKATVRSEGNLELSGETVTMYGNGDSYGAISLAYTNPSGSAEASSSFAKFILGQAFSDPTQTAFEIDANNIFIGTVDTQSGGGDSTIVIGNTNFTKNVSLSSSGSVNISGNTINTSDLNVVGSVVASVGFTGSLNGTADLATTSYNNNTNSGSLGFWQGTQAEYDLISGSASDSIIYFVI